MMLTSKEVPIRESALLVIDAQDSFKATALWQRRNNLAFEANVAALIEAYRTAGLPLFFVLHTDSDEGFQPGNPLVRLMEFIQPRSNEPVLVKSTRNCFTSTDLQMRLVEKGVRRLIITGIQMEQCCETTTRLAADLGYAVDFISEATMTFPIVDTDTGEELGVDEIAKRTEFCLRRRFARIATVNDILQEIRGDRLIC